MEDVAPKLYENLERSFQNSLKSNSSLNRLMSKVTANGAKYADAGNYAEQVSQSLAGAFKECLSSAVLPDGKMYWNIAERTVKPLYEEAYELASSAAETVQKSLNAGAGIGLKAQKAGMDNDIISGIMNAICNVDHYDDAADVLAKSAYGWGRTVVDQTLKKNVDFQSKAGLSPRVVRKAGARCCDWCADLEGTYSYPSVPDDVYHRHENCKCSVDYYPDKSKSRAQDVWSKEWSEEDEVEKRKERRNFTGLDLTVDKEKLKTLNLMR